jgi:hypothetical protein
VIIIHTSARNVPNWKDNVLATLVYGIHDEGRRAFEKLNDEGNMEDAARKLMVRLEGWVEFDEAVLRHCFLDPNELDFEQVRLSLVEKCHI